MLDSSMSRREVLAMMAASAVAPAAGKPERKEHFITRGVVLYPWDLSLADWPERACRAGITTIGLHAARSLDVLVDFVKSERGTTLLEKCRHLGIKVEYELHALGTLLSREWFCAPNKDLFRLDGTGHRNPDCNCCPSSEEALKIIAGKAVEYGRVLSPTSDRYFFWPDDAQEWCGCPDCKRLSSTDQAVLVENAIVAALRKHLNPKAVLSHISYGPTLSPPRLAKPHEGLFLEFAPIARVYDHAIDDPSVKLGGAGTGPKSHTEYLEILDANLDVFPKETAQVLEYWLDVSRFSGWKRPLVKAPWSNAVMKADANAYAKRGIRHVTTFATWIDADYVRQFGDPPLAEYVKGLMG